VREGVWVAMGLWCGIGIEAVAATHTHETARAGWVHK
jgi:hypothetical protein